MICINCRDAADQNKPEFHQSCWGPTRCDCQHRTEPNQVIKSATLNSTDQNGDMMITHRD